MEINIEEYEICSPTSLGEGSYSEVFAVMEKSSKKIYAAKILKQDVYDEESDLRIRREIEIISSCIHPTIIKFYGFSNKDFSGNNNIVIIMEYAKNKSLSEAIKNAKCGMANPKYDNTKIQIILIGIARAMMILHQKRIIHRDLKPDNILLDENFQPLISDFNLSKMCKMGESYNQSHNFGTPAYMAPEVFFASEKYNNFKADVFSFGAIMYEILTNEQLIPVKDIKSPKDMIKCRQNLVIKFKVPIKDEFKKLIEQCLSNDPNERPNFNEIYNKLKNVNNKDFALDDIDVDEVNDYIELISKKCEEDKFGSMLGTVDYLEKQSEDLLADVSYLKQCCKEFSKLKSDTEQLMKDNELFKKECETMKSDKEQLMKDNKLFKEECEKMKSDRDQLMQDNEFIKKECDQAKLERGQLDERVKRLEKLLEGLLLKVENCESSEKITLIFGRIEQIEKDIQSMKLSYKPETGGSYDEIWKKIKEMMYDIEQFKVQIRDQIKVQDTISINELEKKVNDLILENDRLKKQINGYNERIQHIDVINHDYVIKIINENKKNDDYSDLYDKLDKLKIKIDNLSHANFHDDSYRNYVIKIINENNSLNSSTDINGILKKLQNQVDKLMRENDELIKKMNSYNEKIQHIDVINHDYVIKIINENNSLNSCTDINGILKKLQNQVDKLARENDELIKKVNNYNEKIQHIDVINHDYVIKVINENKSLNRGSDISKDLEELRNQVNKLARENGELIKKVNSYDAKIQHTNEMNEQAIIKKIKEIHLDSYDDRKTNIEFYENKIKELVKQNEIKNQQIIDQQMKFNQRIQTIETKNTEIIQIQSNQSSKQSLSHGLEISDLVSLIHKMEGKLNSVIQDNERLKEKVKMQEQQLQGVGFNNNNNQLMEMILKLENRVESNERDNALLKKQLNDQEAKFSQQSRINQDQRIQQIKKDPVVKPGTGYRRPKPSPNLFKWYESKEKNKISNQRSLDPPTINPLMPIENPPTLNSSMPIENPMKVVSIDYFKGIHLSNPNSLNLKNLLQYILQYGDESEAEKYIDIQQDMKEVYINSPATELLYKNNQLGQDNFNRIINSFELFTIEFEYPSRSFNDIYQCISKNIYERYKSKASILLKILNLEDIQSMIKEKNYISKIKLDSGIESILTSSFSGCNELKNITIPDSVLSIDNFSFDNCSSLMNFKIPNRLKFVGNFAFRNCSKLTEISIPGTVETIGNYAFNNCAGLTKVVFPTSSVTKSIGDFAFCDCTKLKEIKLPSSINEIGEGSFKNCRKIIEITIPKNVNKIGNDLFDGCISLIQVALPKSLKIDKKNGINDNIKIKKI